MLSAAPVTTTSKCPRCWKQLPPTARFCRRCGAGQAHPPAPPRRVAPPPVPRRGPAASGRRGSSGAAFLGIVAAVMVFAFCFAAPSSRRHGKARETERRIHRYDDFGRRGTGTWGASSYPYSERYSSPVGPTGTQPGVGRDRGRPGVIDPWQEILRQNAAAPGATRIGPYGTNSNYPAAGPRTGHWNRWADPHRSDLRGRYRVYSPGGPHSPYGHQPPYGPASPYGPPGSGSPGTAGRR